MSQMMSPLPLEASEVPFTDREGKRSTTITAKPSRGRLTLRFLRHGWQPRHPGAVLAAIQVIHTLAWFSIESCMVYLLYAGFMECSDRRAALAAAIVRKGGFFSAFQVLIVELNKCDWSATCCSQDCMKHPPVHYTVHYTFITPPPYTCSRKDERQAGVQEAMRYHHRCGDSWNTPDQARCPKMRK
jgi:hypothetical protein